MKEEWEVFHVYLDYSKISAALLKTLKINFKGRSQNIVTF